MGMNNGGDVIVAHSSYNKDMTQCIVSFDHEMMMKRQIRTLNDSVMDLDVDSWLSDHLLSNEMNIVIRFTHK